MKIVRVSVLEFRRALDGRSWNPSFRWIERRAPLLLLHADDGTSGVGEAWSRQPAITQVLDHLAREVAPRLVGRNIDEHSRLVDEAAMSRTTGTEPWVTPAAASAADIALWDLRAKRLEQPLWRVLANSYPRADGTVPVYASGGLYRDGSNPVDLAREMLSYVQQGFTAVKMKIGGLPLDDDLARVRAVRAAVGPRTTLWADAVNQLSAANVATWCEGLAKFDVGALQAPVPFDDIATMAAINGYAMPVVAAEAEFRRERFAALLDAGAVTYLQFCLGLCGGLSGGTRLNAMASTHRVALTPQCFSTAVMQAASLHFGAAHPNVATVEYHRFHDHLAMLLPSAMRVVERGRIRLDDTPGLGLQSITLGIQPGGGTIHPYGQTHQRSLRRGRP